ncbi:hypothetical protein H2200_004468 [Cladophialophora chaetospira]|uniref:Uncharacterized protein n=1 Tax=Cladophialophora chaetospira TaxID=386627 RepID=A0AA39CK75_9EURO|nr:hypothetical protein H2200_004468 [Cladophialophora chaetospira]
MSQQIAGLVPGTAYTLGFDYSIPFSNEEEDPLAIPCSLLVSLGGNPPLPGVVLYRGPARPAWVRVDDVPIVAGASNNILEFGWDCSELGPSERVDFTLDNVVLERAYCVPPNPSSTSSTTSATSTTSVSTITTTTSLTTTTTTSSTTTSSVCVAPTPTCDVIVDGGFECVAEDALNEAPITSGGWTVSTGAVFQQNGGNSITTTPFGTKYALLIGQDTAIPTLSQDLSGLIVGGLYIFDFQYDVALAGAPEGSVCNLEVLYGNQLIAFVTIVPTDNIRLDFEPSF